MQSCYLKNSLREFAVQRGAAVQGSFGSQEQVRAGCTCNAYM